MPSWSELSDDGSERGDAVASCMSAETLVPGTPAPATLRSRSRSPVRVAARAETVAEVEATTPGTPVNLSWVEDYLAEPEHGEVHRPGIDWWLTPLKDAIAAGPAAHIFSKKPAREMVHASLCSGMLTELVGQEALRTFS